MFERRYADGETVYQAADPSDAVYRVRSGQVRLTFHDATGRLTSTVVDAGGVFGETRLVSAGERNAVARAVGNVLLDVIPREDALREFEVCGGPMRGVLIGLFERSPTGGKGKGGRRTARAPAPDPTPDPIPDPTPDPISDPISDSPTPGTASPKQPAPDRRPSRQGGGLVLKAAHHQLTKALGADGLTIANLPFRVGRRPDRGNPDMSDFDLCLPDRKPYRISRRHFAIEANGQGYIVRDLGSFHGTVVNGVALGGNQPARTAPLAAGRNEIRAGGRGSPFRFILLIGNG